MCKTGGSVADETYAPELDTGVLVLGNAATSGYVPEVLEGAGDHDGLLERRWRQGLGFGGRHLRLALNFDDD